MEWNMEENFSMEWNIEWKIVSMEWKKIASMEYGKIVFNSIPYHAMPMYKKGSKSLCRNYCPISLLSSLSKIFEKVVSTAPAPVSNMKSLLHRQSLMLLFSH